MCPLCMYCLFNIIVLHFQLVVEAADGATLAAAMSDQLKQMDPNMIHIGIILCGGNVDMEFILVHTRLIKKGSNQWSSFQFKLALK